MNKIFVTRSSMPPYEEYIEAIRSLWDTHWLTNMGTYHQNLESKLKDYLDVPNLSLMVNGHMALELTIQSFGFPEGSEIITTPFTFISTTHAIVRNRLNPIFCDVNPEDGTINENKIEDLITENTVAIIPVHVYGNICDIEAIQSIADKYNLKVIYDAAHAFGIKYKNKGIGNYGDASIFSFHATKVFNTIEGGAVTFDDKKMYDKLYNLKNFGIRGEELVTEVGANAKMNELSAIMGLCNLNHLSDVYKSRKNVFSRYVDAISTINGLRLLKKKEDDNNYAYFPIIIEDDYPVSRDQLYDILKQSDIYSRKYFYPLTSDQVCFKNKYRNVSLDVARDLSSRVLSLPIYEGLSETDQSRILNILKSPI